MFFLFASLTPVLGRGRAVRADGPAVAGAAVESDDLVDPLEEELEDVSPEELEAAVDVDDEGSETRKKKVKKTKPPKSARTGPKPVRVILKDAEELASDSRALNHRLTSKKKRVLPSAGRGKGKFDVQQWEAAKEDKTDLDEFSLSQLAALSEKRRVSFLLSFAFLHFPPLFFEK